MSTVRTSRKFHKWLMLFLGIQFVIWSVTGAYMVIIDLSYIHGNNLVADNSPSVDTKNIPFKLADVIKKYPNATDIELTNILDQNVYHLMLDGKALLISALNGQELSHFDEAMAIKLANYYYSGNDPIKKVTLYTQNPPYGLRESYLPAYRIDYDAFSSPSLYISAESGKLVRYRHNFWRIFDWMFRFHLADYNNREHDNWLLFWLTLFSIAACVFGIILSYFAVIKKPQEHS